MPRFDNPIVLMTRPKGSSDQFIAELAPICGSFEPIVSPAFENVATGIDLPDFKSAIFTSRAGVEFAPEGGGRMAYCVGSATAQAATQAGYRAIDAQGSASGLIALILARAPSEGLLHIRGEISIGDVMDKVREGGVRCSQAIAYRKAPMRPAAEVRGGLTSGRNVLLPVFSAETVSILSTWGFDFSGVHVVAISQAVGDAAALILPNTITVSRHPNQTDMAIATALMIA